MADPIPTTKYPASITLSHERIGQVRSVALNGRSVTRSNGAARLSLSVQWPLMTRVELDEMYAFLADHSDGSQILFDTHDRRTPRGVATGSPIIRNRQNLLTYSDDTSNAAWTKTNCSITSASGATPVGNMLRKIVENTATAYHYISRNYNVTSGGRYIFTVYAKQTAERNILIKLGNSALWPGGLEPYIFVNLYTGAVQSTINLLNYGVEQITVGADIWYRVYITQDCGSSGTSALYVFLTKQPSSTSYTGDGVSGIHVAGISFESTTAHLNPGVYINTTTTAITDSPQTGTTIYTYGWTPSTANIMMSGDLVKLSGSEKCYMTTSNCSSDYAGNAVINLISPLVAVPANGAVITVNNTPITVELDGGSVRYGVDTSGLYTLSASFREAW